MITQEFILKWHGTIPQKAMEDVIRLVENERARTIEEIHTKLVSAFNKKYSFNDSHLLEFEVLDIISDTINQMKEQK